MSAINIPDMSYIVKEHGLSIVPLDVSLTTVAPKIENLEHLITERTKLIILAHVYGKRYDLTPFLTVARKYRLPVIEDCAEVFTGLDYTGHPDVDLSMFSFGTIKNNTSFGGAMVKVSLCCFLWPKIYLSFSFSPTHHIRVLLSPVNNV